MIKVTLEFNSEEELRAYFTRDKVQLASTDKIVAVEGPKPTTVAQVVAERNASGSTLPAAKDAAAKKNAAAPSEPAAPAASTASSTVDYASLQKAVFNLANKSREAAAAVVAAFGVKTFRDLPADKWESALTAVNAKLAFLESGK